jgi:hypothetical protein
MPDRLTPTAIAGVSPYLQELAPELANCPHIPEMYGCAHFAGSGYRTAEQRCRGSR